MTEFVRGFVIPEVADVHQWFQKCIRDAERLLSSSRGKPQERVFVELVNELNTAYRVFNTNLKEVALAAAALATADMHAKLKEHERPSAGNSPTSTELVTARPLETGAIATGAVGVADVTMLSRMINPNTPGYHSYWRALEYGTGQHGVPSQIGRVLLGVFDSAGGGDATAPDSQYAGGRGPHPVFRSKKNLSGADARAAGFGTIGKEDTGKHFIQHGADAALIKWRQDIGEIQQRAIRALDAIVL